MKTDNNPLTYMMSTPNFDAVGHCWVASLAGFNFTIEYLRGIDNKVADTQPGWGQAGIGHGFCL